MYKTLKELTLIISFTQLLDFWRGLSGISRSYHRL